MSHGHVVVLAGRVEVVGEVEAALDADPVCAARLRDTVPTAPRSNRRRRPLQSRPRHSQDPSSHHQDPPPCSPTRRGDATRPRPAIQGGAHGRRSKDVVNELPSTHFDLIAIGSGPAGQRAAVQAAKLGKRVGARSSAAAPLGGVSTNTGTVPSKTLRAAIVELDRPRGGGLRQRVPRPARDHDRRSALAHPPGDRARAGGDRRPVAPQRRARLRAAPRRSSIRTRWRSPAARRASG